MITPYSYQQKTIISNPLKSGIFYSCGMGKTFLTLCLAEGSTLVIATKTIRDDRVWERQLEKMNNNPHKITFLKVISKEDFRRDFMELSRFDTVILEESHTLCGLTPNTRWRKGSEIPKASQIFESCQNYLKKNNPKRLYLCTATPIKNPMTVLAIAWLLGKEWDFYNWRQTFYTKLPMPGRIQAFVAKKDEKTKDKLAKVVCSLGPTGRLSDFADVPEQSHVVKNIPLTEEQKREIKALPIIYPDPIVLIGKKHQIEQGVLIGNEFEETRNIDNNKIDAILDLCEQYDKVLIFAKYTAQIELIKKSLSDLDHMVFTLTGATKDRREVIFSAENSKKCVVICQSQISSGFELPSFRCTIFASEDWSYVNHEQSIGRTLRMNALAKNLYVYLISGEIDKAVRETLLMRKDFSERIYLKI